MHLRRCCRANWKAQSTVWHAARHARSQPTLKVGAPGFSDPGHECAALCCACYRKWLAMSSLLTPTTWSPQVRSSNSRWDCCACFCMNRAYGLACMHTAYADALVVH